MEIRQAFVPRPGHIFCQVDYPALELHALSQVCFDLLKFSSLGKAINAGLDPHLSVAKDILRVSYEEAKARKKEDDVDDARQTGKVANFGIPGGLGAPKLVLFAKKGYNVTFDPDPEKALEFAKNLKKTWLQTWPEMRDYFYIIGRLTDNAEGRAVFQHLRSNRWRGGASYTSTCNSYFQGLGADAATAAGYEISRACYVEEDSPLFGCRLVNFIHDEFILEAPIARAHEAAVEMGRIAAKVANEWMPQCPFAPLEALLMSRWSKAAFPVYGADNRLTAWRPQDWKIVQKQTVPVNDNAWRKTTLGWQLVA